MAEPHERSLRAVPLRQARPRAGKLRQILQDGRQRQPTEPRRSGGRERETKATSEVQTLASTCITGPGQTRCEPGTRTLLFHWWRPAGRVKPTPYDRLCACPGALRTMHLRHLRGSRQKARRGSIDASLRPVTPGISHRDRFTLGGIRLKLAGGNPDRMLSGTPRLPAGPRDRTLLHKWGRKPGSPQSACPTARVQSAPPSRLSHNRVGG